MILNFFLSKHCNCNCNLFQIQSDPDTGWKIKFHKPLDIECVLKSIKEMFQLFIGTSQSKT
jgi:hypothetical protein